MNHARGWLPILTILIGLFMGCMGKQTPKPEDLMGVWVSETLQTEWGPAKLEIRFSGEREVEFIYTFKNGESLAAKGSYQLSGRKFVSDAMKKDEPMEVWLEEGELVVHMPPEPAYRLRRK